MSMHVTDKELQKLINKIGYKGCKNCKHQISPLRMCKWAEQGGDGQIHFLCPKWDKAESEDKELEEIDFIQPKKVVGKLISVDVLDKIRAEIERQEKWLFQAGYTAYNVDIAFDAIKAAIAESEG